MMNQYFKFFLAFAIVVFLCSSIQAQAHFPDQCIGTWEGMMHIYSKGQLRDSVKVRFTVTKLDEPNSWTWKKEYRSPTRPMTKDYILRLDDEATKRYVTDEQNDIYLNEYLFDNKLYSIFETGGYLLTSSYELRGDQLIFEVTSGTKVNETGEGVQNYSVNNVQRVVFKRVE